MSSKSAKTVKEAARYETCIECKMVFDVLAIVWVRDEGTLKCVCETCALKEYFFSKCEDCKIVLESNKICESTDETGAHVCDECNAKREGAHPHACGSYLCIGDCGVMWCGCIDVCRCDTDRD